MGCRRICWPPTKQPLFQALSLIRLSMMNRRCRKKTRRECRSDQSPAIHIPELTVATIAIPNHNPRTMPMPRPRRAACLPDSVAKNDGSLLKKKTANHGRTKFNRMAITAATVISISVLLDVKWSGTNFPAQFTVTSTTIVTPMLWATPDINLFAFSRLLISSASGNAMALFNNCADAATPVHAIHLAVPA